MINSIVMVGNIVKDCEIKHFENSDKISLSIAVNEWQKNGTVAHFFDIEYWVSSAGNLAPHLTKGAKIALQGSLARQRWEKDGKKYSKIIIKARNIDLLSYGEKRQETSEELPF